jgi:hypoxanthine phosphoribosyltransferase
MNKAEIVLHGKRFVPYLSAEQIDEALTKLADALHHDFKGKEVIILGILDGAFMVMSDLVRKLTFSPQLDFIKLKSYEGQQSTGQVRQLMGLSSGLTDKHLVIVEDIIDTGNTLEQLLQTLDGYQPASVSVLTLLIKEEVFKNKFKVHYQGISIANKFVVGYGMDFDGLGRQLPEIYAANE